MLLLFCQVKLLDMLIACMNLITVVCSSCVCMEGKVGFKKLRMSCQPLDFRSSQAYAIVQETEIQSTIFLKKKGTCTLMFDT